MMPATMPGWRRGLGRFARDRASALGLALLLVLIVAAIFAPILAPFPGDVADFHTVPHRQPPARARRRELAGHRPDGQ